MKTPCFRGSIRMGTSLIFRTVKRNPLVIGGCRNRGFGEPGCKPVHGNRLLARNAGVRKMRLVLSFTSSSPLLATETEQKSGFSPRIPAYGATTDKWANL